MVILVRGTDKSANHADRILAAMASVAMGRYNRRVLVMQTTDKYPVEEILMGNMLQNDRLKSEAYSMEDSGMDALMRRILMGSLTAEQFSDCSTRVASTANSLDIAGISKDAEFESQLLENINVFGELVKSASAVYDSVFILADAGNKALVAALEEIADSEIVCVPQGPAEPYSAAPGCFYAVDTYDAASFYTAKYISKMYGSKLVFPFPYNIGFKDACLRQNARYFMFTNYAPESDDDNAGFIDSVAKLVGNVLGVDEPFIRERPFVYRKNRQITDETN